MFRFRRIALKVRGPWPVLVPGIKGQTGKIRCSPKIDQESETAESFAGLRAVERFFRGLRRFFVNPSCAVRKILQ
jgi:hypothetical protein